MQNSYLTNTYALYAEGFVYSLTTALKVRDDVQITLISRKSFLHPLMRLWGEGTSAGIGGGRVTVSHGSSTTTSQTATANSGVSHDKDQKADDDDRDAGGRRNEDDNRNVVDEEEETSFVIED